MYKEALIKSGQDLKHNLILFLPDTIIFLINLLLGLLFLKSSGLLKLITDPVMVTRELETMAPVIKLFFKENMLKIIISFALFILTSFLIGSGFTAMKFGMMKDLIEKQNLTIKKMINNGRYVGQVISMKMIMFVIGTVTFLFTLGTGIILSTFILKGYSTLIMALFFPLLVMLLQLLLLFRYQIMFLEKKHTITAVKESFEYFFKNKKRVFTIWLIIIAASFITAPVSAYLGFAEQKTTTLSIIAIIGYFLRGIAGIIINVWADMFKFRSYESKL